jgi:hypothetical protein
MLYSFFFVLVQENETCHMSVCEAEHRLKNGYSAERG